METGLKGILFFDVGQAYEETETIDIIHGYEERYWIWI